jgi:hypothetical protein
MADGAGIGNRSLPRKCAVKAKIRTPARLVAGAILCSGMTGAERYFGASTITICRPSNLASISILATLVVSSFTRSSNFTPNS